MTTAVKERPILFSAEMVRALLDGRKTQTRRVVKPQPVNAPFWSDMLGHWVESRRAIDGQTYRLRCPYGQSGDRLWVRETFRAHMASDPHLEYRAGGVAFEGDQRCYTVKGLTVNDANAEMDGDKSHRPSWRPAIHMPRWASRITLEIESVRVERLWQITRADVLAEGIEPQHLEKNDKFFHRGDVPGITFREVWDPLNAKRGFGWDTNCYVWVLSFKRIQP